MKILVEYGFDPDGLYPFTAKAKLDDRLLFAVGESWEKAEADLLAKVKRARAAGEIPAPKEIDL